MSRHVYKTEVCLTQNESYKLSLTFIRFEVFYPSLRGAIMMFCEVLICAGLQTFYTVYNIILNSENAFI